MPLLNIQNANLQTQNKIGAKMEIKLLDCTLRDGGYYNGWDFDPGLVEEYLLAMYPLNVDHVELGFRFIGADGF